MSGNRGKPKNVLRRDIRRSGGVGSMSRSPGPRNQLQPTATQANTDIQLASIPSNQTSIHGNQTSIPSNQASIHDLIKQIKAAHDVMRKEKWSYTDRHGQEIYVAERIGRVLDSFETCAKIIDVAIQHHPDITALVWAGARFILMIVRNGIRFMDDLEAAIATTVEKMAACEYYAQIYHECLEVRLESAMTTKTFEDGLDSALKDLYGAVHAFLNKAMEYINPGTSAVRNAINHLKLFSVTMQPLIQAIEDREKKVKEYADMATIERIKEHSSKLQEIQGVMVNIRKQMESLAKVDDISNVTKDNFNISRDNFIVSKDHFNVTKEVRDTLVELQKLVVPGLQSQQRGILSQTPLDEELQYLKDQYMAESQDTNVFEASLYVPAQGMKYPHAPVNEHFDLATHVQGFLAQDSPQKVCLIQGVAGSGKSTFNHYLATELWDAYCNADAVEKSSIPIPVFIPLANVYEPNRHNQDLIADFFRYRSYWTDEVILRAKKQLRFVFILDGYDEIEIRDRNFYISNRLAEWKAKIVITSRPEYLGEGYQKGFIPPGQVLREFWIAPFSTTAMREYINKYVKSRSKGTMADYEQFLQRHELRPLISIPFLLRMVLTVDPRTITITDETDFKRGTLYQEFLTHWLEQGHDRLLRVQLPLSLREAFTTLRERNFTGKAKRFCLDFAVELYRHKVLQVEYDGNAPHCVWHNYLTDSDSQKRLLRYSLPLIRVGQVSYRFIHKSLRDFAIAQAIWQDDKIHSADALINEFHIVDDSGVIDFIVEEAERNPALQQALLDCANRSKGSTQFAQAASNAITILVRSGWRFNGSDLRGIRVDRADISDGWFDGAQLQNADLREVRARGVWLRGADLTDARMDGIWFGEKPCLGLNLKKDEGIKASTCFYSAEGELLIAFAINVKDTTNKIGTVREVQVWSVSNRQLLHSFESDNDELLAFSPDGRLLASACFSDTIRLYGLHQSHQKPRILKGDFYGPDSLAFSVDGKLLALASMDKPVYLWSVESGNIVHTFTFPGYSSSIVTVVAFSPDGKLFAFGDSDSQVHVWSMEDYSLVHTFGDYADGYVRSIAFSPDNQVLATWHDKFYLQRWSLSRLQLIDTFADRQLKTITEMCYAPDGQMIATLSEDKIVCLWSVQARKVLHEFHGVESSIAFSPDGQLLAGRTADGSARQWAISQLGNTSQKIGPTTGIIDRVAFWSDNKVLITASVQRVTSRQNVYVRFWPLVTCATTNFVDLKVLRNIPVMKLGGLDRGDGIASADHIHLALNSAFIIGGLRNGYAFYWFEDEKPKYINRRIRSNVLCVAISPDGELVACTCKVSDDSCSLKLIKRQTGELIYEFEDVCPCQNGMAFSHGGQLIALAHKGVVQFLSVPEHRLLHTIVDYDSQRMGNWETVGFCDKFKIAFSPDDQMVAFPGIDATIRLWSTSTPNFKPPNTFKGHTEIISGIVFSPDGDIIASGSYDRTLRFWSVRSMRYLFSIDTRREISTLAWRDDPGSEDLAVGTEDSVVQLWRVRKKADYTPENPSVEVSCQWSSRLGLLYAPNLQIHDVTGLDAENLELLRQVGAVGEPVGTDGRIREIIEVDVRRGIKRGWTEELSE